MTEQECEQVLLVLTAAWPKADMPSVTVNLYKRCLRDLPVEAGRAAALQAVTTLKFMPTIAELRELVAQLQERADNRPSVEDAWREFRCVAASGVAVYPEIYGEPQWSHPAIAAAARVLSLRDFAMADVATHGVWFAQFRKVYEAQGERERDSARMLPDVRSAIAALAAAKAMPVLDAGDAEPVSEPVGEGSDAGA